MRPIRPTILMIAGIMAASVVLAGCGDNPNAIGNMPGPVQQVIDTATLSGNNMGINMLTVTGNQGYIGRGTIPGYYSYGPADDQGDNTYYVNFEIPINMSGIEKQLGYQPRWIGSTTIETQDYVNIMPLPNEAFDRLYFDPNTHYAPFSFKLNANGTVMDESWDAVAVNS